MRCASVTDVLLVDFSDAVRTTSSEILHIAGYSVAQTDDSETALRLLEERRFRLLLLDPDLPNTSGIELLQSVEDLPPVVIVSAHPITPEDLRSVDPKVSACFTKPLLPSKLIFIVNSVISRSDRDLNARHGAGL